ncbi:MAG: flavodoxin family protein [Candidatus Bathyarchaeota archaeon]|jgi:multimeric flavodoxin WrbA
MKVLGIVAGPRRNGHTAKLVEAVLRGAKEAGHDTDIFYLGDMDINPIGAGEDCYIYPEDDMALLYPHLESMGALVLGTPIYYDHVSSRCKLFIDRLHYYSRTHGEEYRRRFPDAVRCVNIITYGWDRADPYDHVLEWMNGRMRGYWGMEVAGNLKAQGTGLRIQEHDPTLIERAEEIGRSL